MQSTSRLTRFHSGTPQGCPLSDISSEPDKALNFFELRVADKKPVLAPPFLVPAVIETLRSSPQYQGLVSLVPGEADAFCAQHLSRRGGVVLTSDSDLLAHNIGEGRVAFFRDLCLDATERIACAMFCPSRIAQGLGPSPPKDLCRLAYERKCSPQASFAQLKKACLLPVMNEADYLEFCQQYVQHEVSPLSLSVNGDAICLDGLDPRMSELVLQLGQSQPGSDHNGSDAKVFLAQLLDSPARGSAWEQSMPTRQLAYTVARWIIPGTSSSVQEYRRVQSVDQRGRQADMMPQSAAREYIDTVLETMGRLAELMPDDQATYWILLSLVLELRACDLNGKSSHTLRTIQSPPATKTSSRIPWDIMHFAASIQAGLYSLRMLKQVLALAPPGEAGLPSSNLAQLRDELSHLPPLAQYPGIDEIVGFVQKADTLGIMKILKEFVHIRDSQAQTTSDSFKVQKKKKKPKKQTSKSPDTTKKAMASANMFGLLATE